MSFFSLQAVLMTPLLARRLYGTLTTAKEGVRIRVYIAAVSTTIVIHMAWLLLPLPVIAKFLVLSVFALLGPWGALAPLPTKGFKF